MIHIFPHEMKRFISKLSNGHFTLMWALKAKWCRNTPPKRIPWWHSSLTLLPIVVLLLDTFLLIVFSGGLSNHVFCLNSNRFMSVLLCKNSNLFPVTDAIPGNVFKRIVLKWLLLAVYCHMDALHMDVTTHWLVDGSNWLRGCPFSFISGQMRVDGKVQ